MAMSYFFFFKKTSLIFKIRIAPPFKYTFTLYFIFPYYINMGFVLESTKIISAHPDVLVTFKESFIDYIILPIFISNEGKQKLESSKV